MDRLKIFQNSVKMTTNYLLSGQRIKMLIYFNIICLEWLTFERNDPEVL